MKKRTSKRQRAAGEKSSRRPSEAGPKSDKALHPFIETLLAAERDGIIRPFLRGIGNAQRELQTKANAGDATLKRNLPELRKALGTYLHTLVQGLDADTKTQLACDLIGDLWFYGGRENARRAKEKGLSMEADPSAAFGVLLIMRDLVSKYCDIVEEAGPDWALEMPLHAIEIVRRLNRIARDRPELVRGIAKELAIWPILAARNYPKTSDFAKLADRIGLATECKVHPHCAQKWKPDTPINEFLLRFMGGLVLTKNEAYFLTAKRPLPNLTPRTVMRWLDRVIMPGLDDIREKEGSWDGIEVIAEILRKVPYEPEHRRHVRNRIKAALEGMARDVKG